MKKEEYKAVVEAVRIAVSDISDAICGGFSGRDKEFVEGVLKESMEAALVEVQRDHEASSWTDRSVDDAWVKTAEDAPMAGFEFLRDEKDPATLLKAYEVAYGDRNSLIKSLDSRIKTNPEVMEKIRGGSSTPAAAPMVAPENAPESTEAVPTLESMVPPTSQQPEDPEKKPGVPTVDLPQPPAKRPGPSTPKVIKDETDGIPRTIK